MEIKSFKVKVYPDLKILFAIGLSILMFFPSEKIEAQGVKFMRDISPAEGIVFPPENPYRDEICLNGKWDFQPISIPPDWTPNTGAAPLLTPPIKDKWETTPIKIPSPWNINEWGAGSEVGEGTDNPYAPSSIYYPSYPLKWGNVKMGWLRRSFTVPSSWSEKRIVLHFEAVMGDFVVLVNGQKTQEYFDGFMPIDIDITNYVKMGGTNELLVGIRHRRLFDKTSTRYKYFRTTYPPGSNTDNLVGIWQDVYLLGLPQVGITNVFVKPRVDKDTLEFDIKLANQSSKTQKITVSGVVKNWINLETTDVLDAPEFKWKLGNDAGLILQSHEVVLKTGETKELIIKTKVQGKLKLWAPSDPNLYTVLFQVKSKKHVYDCKSERFGWRQFTINGEDFNLNGKKIQCFADIQHPFGAYVCSRRFAWAWFKMIKDFGGNAVRLHAQPWPEFYYQLADEMGIMVIDESALFGSSLSLNFGEDITWERTAEHIDALVLRDRNHPSVIGWSIGNELFAVAMYNKPSEEVAKNWDKRVIELAKRPSMLDPTRPFVTDDGDEDMRGNLPVWSKHFEHGLHLERLPDTVKKPLIVGENGATYYGTPSQLYQFAGEQAYESYHGRSEALAVDLFQNVVKMALPRLAYFSPSELCWFGIEHMNLGYHDYTRLPDQHDGIFAGLPYVEGKPGYQIEHIPPYVSTFNPGLDPELPLYKPLPMFEAMKSALSGQSQNNNFVYTLHQPKSKPPFPDAIYKKAYFVGDSIGSLANTLKKIGVEFTGQDEETNLVFIDGDATEATVSRAQSEIDKVRKAGGLIWIMLADRPINDAVKKLLPDGGQVTWRKATSLQPNKSGQLGPYFELPDLYFSELEGDRNIIKHGLGGQWLKQGEVLLEATNVDWSLFNRVTENKKCAQVVLYEHLEKPSGAALIRFESGSDTVLLSTIDYHIFTHETISFWRTLLSAMRIKLHMDIIPDLNDESQKVHDLMLDGPVNKSKK
jgi:beta-galactosidase